jgi:hypothetical protein
LAEPIDEGTAAPWMKLLRDAEEKEYHEVCDNLDDLYSSLRKLTKNRGDRQYQMLWANLEVQRPSIYSRPPTPVVTSKFKDRKPLPRKAADILERALVADVENDNLHDTMMLERDDLVMAARAVPWLRIVERDGLEVPSAVHISRKDFRCDPARKWSEVQWVARQVWLTKGEVKARFGDVPEDMNFQERPEDRDKRSKDRGVRKVSIWEMWHKPSKKCLWVSDGVKDVLEERDPPLDLTGFFPCPRPAYATLQRNSLTPVPDAVYYRDQLNEINDLTARIADLQQGLRMVGFYASGNPDIADAVETAFKTVNARMLVPISTFAAMSDAVMMWPVTDVVNALQGCMEVRRQVVQDVYEITGISDIMRGSTEADETLGAQQLKSQYGSIRIKEKQGELVRLARDIIRMKAEIMCENVAIEDLLLMAQVDDIPTDAKIAEQAQQIQMQAMQQGQQMLAQMQQMPPEQAQQVEQQINQAAQQVQQQLAPQLGKIVAESIRFVTNGFRPGRQMDEAIDELAEEFANYQPPPQAAQGEDPEAAKMQAQAAMAKAEADAKKAESDSQLAQAELPMKQQEAQDKSALTSAEIELKQATTQLTYAKIEGERMQGQLEAQAAQVDMTLKAKGEQRADNQFRQDNTFRQREVGRADKESAAKVAAMKQRKPNV